MERELSSEEVEVPIQQESVKSFWGEVPRKQDSRAFQGMASLRVLRTSPQTPSSQA